MIKTKKMANGTYAWGYGDGDWFETQAVTPWGARVQGIKFRRRMDEFSEHSRSNYIPTDMMLEG
ncbi:hypothetical protein ACGFYT_29915 [Streptomyces sp. NPDC048208]|uniref:hypothetical protein n=1 Tax=Streptomyces sp. NPDC048208 TaxID=3365515 RepID=UPI00371B2200